MLLYLFQIPNTYAPQLHSNYKCFSYRNFLFGKKCLKTCKCLPLDDGIIPGEKEIWAFLIKFDMQFSYESLL